MSSWFGKWLNPKGDTATVAPPEAIPPSIFATLRKAGVDASNRLGGIEIRSSLRDGSYVFVADEQTLEIAAALVDSGYYSTADIANMIVAAFGDGGN